MSKYRNRKTVVDNIKFDSQAEAYYYNDLKLLKRAGEILDFELQPVYELIPAYKHPVTGRTVKGIEYRADFKVVNKDGSEDVVDVKGFKTAVYKLKKKMFEQKYGIPIKEVDA